MVKLGTSPNAYVHRPMPGPDAPPFKDSRFNKEYLELFEYIVECIREKNFKADAAELDGAFVLEFSFPGLYNRNRVKVRLVVDEMRLGRASIEAPGPKGRGRSFTKDFRFW
jgi:hypothetical protein